MTMTPLTPFKAAELATERAMASAEVQGAKLLESILGGDGEWTAEVAFQVWCDQMTELGFPEYATADDAA